MKTFQLILFTCLLSFVSNPLHSQSNDQIIEGISLDRLNRYQDFIKSEIEEGKIPGAVSIINRNGTTIYSSSLGYSNFETKSPMMMDNIFSIQSMTKPIITVAFMMLYEEGHFLLTDPVSKYLPSFKDLSVIKNFDDGVEGETIPANQEIKIHNLLTHTSGLTYGFGSSQYDQDFRELWSKDHKDISERVNAYLGVPLKWQPGEKWDYSVATDVLSVLIEHFSGMTTIEFLKSRLFEPLKMDQTDYNLNDESLERIVLVHVVSDNGDLIVSDEQLQYQGNTIWQGKSGLFSSASDYINFCQMLVNDGELFGHHFLSPKTIELMTTNQIGDLEFPRPGYDMGLGFAVTKDLGEIKNLGTKGLYFWSGAYTTHFFIDPEEKIVAVFMTQKPIVDQFYLDKMQQLIYQAVIE